MDPHDLDAFAKALVYRVPRRPLLLTLLGLAASGLTSRLGARGAPATQADCGVICPEGQVLDETCSCAFVNAIACEGLTDCGGFCVDLVADPYNCGACGNICASGLCAGGACTVIPVGCTVGLTDCFGACTDLLSDPYNCGTCGVTCESESCTGGACEQIIPPPGCTRPFVDCYGNGTCVDLSSDPYNCGQCGTVCTSQICARSVCTENTLGCPSGLVPCSSICTDVSIDPRNCGGCGIHCATGGRCEVSMCTKRPAAAIQECAAPLVDCGIPNACSDLNDDKQNCGSCGNACPAGDVCIGGACCRPNVLPNGLQAPGCRPATLDCGALANCNGICVDKMTDGSNCGTCGNVCQAGGGCAAGRCTSPTPSAPGNRPLRAQTRRDNSPSELATTGQECPQGTTNCKSTCVINCRRGRVLDTSICRCIKENDETAPEVRKTRRDELVSDVPNPDGAWIHPQQDFRGDCLHLAALAYPFSPGDPPIKEVIFTVWYPGIDWTTACSVSDASADDPDRYECVWDHAAHEMPEGPVEVNFAVFNTAGHQTRSPDGVRQGVFVPQSIEPRFQLPMRGKVRVVGNLPGEGDHIGPDRFAVDLESDDPAVYATAPGTVTFSGESCEMAASSDLRCYGTVVVIDHGGGWYSVYAHVADDEFLPSFGDPVAPSTRIGTMSDTGCFDNAGRNRCDSKHLQFAVRRGATCLVGQDPLTNAIEPVDIWTRIPGLPTPPMIGLL